MRILIYKNQSGILKSSNIGQSGVQQWTVIFPIYFITFIIPVRTNEVDNIGMVYAIVRVNQRI